MKNKFIRILLCIIMLLSAVTAFAENQEPFADPSNLKPYLADVVVNASQLTTGKIGSIGNDAYIRIPKVYFEEKQYTSLEIEYGVSDSYAGATLSVYIDSMDSAPIAQYVLKSTGDFGIIGKMKTDLISDITGIHDVYVTFSQSAACSFCGLSFKTADGDMPEEIYELPNKDKIIKLYKLGIIDYQAPFRPDKLVTNSEVLAAVRKISDQFTISDADFKTQYSYSPLDNATRDSIVKIFSLAAGYSDITGGGDLGVFKNVVMRNSNITRKEFVNCLDNFLDVKVVETTFTNLNGSKKISDESVMNKCMGIYEYKGIVQSNSMTSLDGAEYTDGVLVGGNVYIKNELDTDMYFGYNVKVYYKEADSGDNELAVIIPHNNSELELTSDAEISRDGLILTYYEGNKKKKATLDARFSLIYNEIYTPVFDNSIFETFNGTLKLIDNNNDNKFDFVIMSDTYDKFVTRVTNDETIYGENGWSINLEAADYIIKNSRGEIISKNEINGIASGTVISIGTALKNGKTIYIITVSSKKITGVIESKKPDGDDIVIIIDETEYKLAKFGTDNISCKADDDVTLYLNAMNQVVKMEKVAIVQKLGFIDNVWVDDNEETVSVRIYNEDQECIKVLCADRIKIDGQIYKKFGDIKNIMLAEKNKEKNEKDIITYSLNSEGNLSHIDYPYTYLGYKESSDSAKRKKDNEDENSIFLSFKGSGKFRKNIMSIEGLTIADNDAKVFLIPSDADYLDYSVESASKYFIDDTNYYDVKGYGMNTNDVYSKAYLIFESAGDKVDDITTAAYIVSVLENSVVYDDETCSTIKYMQNGNKYEAIVRNDSSVGKIISGLNCGDMVQMTVDEKNVVKGLEPLYLTGQGKIYDNQTATEWGRTGSNVKTTFNSARYVVRDRISKIIGSKAVLENSGLIIEIENPRRFGTNFCIYDESKNDRNKVSAADSNDIGEGCEIVINLYYGNVNGLIILR